MWWPRGIVGQHAHLQERYRGLRCAGLAPELLHWDDDLPGFGMRVDSRQGISFIVKGRVKGSAEQKFVTLGRWPALLPDQARRKARSIKAAASMRLTSWPTVRPSARLRARQLHTRLALSPGGKWATWNSLNALH
jgi:hypothetical protein